MRCTLLIILLVVSTVRSDENQTLSKMEELKNKTEEMEKKISTLQSLIGRIDGVTHAIRKYTLKKILIHKKTRTRCETLRTVQINNYKITHYQQTASIIPESPAA